MKIVHAMVLDMGIRAIIYPKNDVFMASARFVMPIWSDNLRHAFHCIRITYGNVRGTLKPGSIIALKAPLIRILEIQK